MDNAEWKMVIPILRGEKKLSIRTWYEGWWLNRFHLYGVLLAHGKKTHAVACQSFAVGFLVFSTKSKKQETPPEWGV